MSKSREIKFMFHDYSGTHFRQFLVYGLVWNWIDLLVVLPFSIEINDTGRILVLLKPFYYINCIIRQYERDKQLNKLIQNRCCFLIVLLPEPIYELFWLATRTPQQNPSKRRGTFRKATTSQGNDADWSWILGHSVHLIRTEKKPDYYVGFNQ